MTVKDALLFIDANKYLDLYRTDQGKKLLAPLSEQMEYIFITQQVVDEVIRNKIQVAAEFLGQKSKGLKFQSVGVPDHLLGSTDGQGNSVSQQMRDIKQRIKNVNEEVDAHVLGIMEQIRLSEDEVSKALAPIFSKAVSFSPDELTKARNRRELGNPPGKSTNPIGDQLTWEQILTHFYGKKRLWIISRDTDYGTVFGGKGFINSLLYADLCRVTAAPEVYLFTDTVDGITHFVETTGVRAESRLTPEEVEEIEKEEKALPTLSQSNEDVRRALAELARPGLTFEALNRVIAEHAMPTSAFDAANRAIAELAAPTSAFAAANRAIAELAVPASAFAAAEQALAELAMPTSAFAAANRAIAELAVSASAFAAANQALAELANSTQKIRALQQSIDEKSANASKNRLLDNDNNK